MQWHNRWGASGVRAPPRKKTAQIKAMFFNENNMHLHQEFNGEVIFI